MILPARSLGASIATYRACGGDLLRYRVLPAPESRHRIVFVHGIESHGEWFLPAARHLGRLAVGSVLLDRRGSGLNRAPDAGHAPSARVLLDDLAGLRRELGPRPCSLVALSWGGKLALAAVLEDPGAWERLVLITPGLVARVDLSWTEKLRLVLCWAARPRARFRIPIEPRMFTSDPHWLEYIRRDPLRLQWVTAAFLRATLALDRIVRARVQELRIPALLLLAGRDEIVDNARTQRLFERAPEGLRSVEVFAGASHSLQFDHVEALCGRIYAFLEEPR